jgi:PKHD-type hydroxylase
MTVFLNEPEEYEGGELVIKTAFGEQRTKLAAGDAVMYPSGSLHHVSEVTQGERRVAVTWIQSMIRSAEQRELLYNLHQARETLLQEKPEAEETRKVDVTYINLVRMWAEL